jgi:type II secretory pathway pseudopilin PulG
LIELLAIIVILAIIAVITVPIILNIIENSRKGAATDSAYGYKDSINKYYVSELSNNKKLKLNGTYEVKANGVLNGNFGVTENTEDRIIPIDGEKPSSGKLHYTNTILDGGCLVIGDYKIIFKSNGLVDGTEKGNCDDYVFPSEQSNGGQSSSAPTIASCPGCKFIYTLDYYYAIEGSDAEENCSSDMPQGTTNDYTTLIGEGGHPYFLGLIESTSNSTKIGRAFVCGIEKDSNDNDVPFCLEGYDPTKWSDDDNVGVFNTIFPGCVENTSDSSASCSGSSMYAYAWDYGNVEVYGDIGYCIVSSDGYVYCSEE